MMQLPQDFTRRMRELLGEEYREFEAAFQEDRSQSLRINGLKAGPQEEGWAGIARKLEQTAGFHLEPVPWAPEGFYYDPQDRPGRHPFHEAGVYYIQEPSAMAVTELLDPRPGDRVLDLCAAPGGKSTHIASRLEGRGFLLSNEIHPARARILSQNIERMGVQNAVVVNEEPETLARVFPDFFDCIAVDAPCSGEGMFRKDAQTAEQWSLEAVENCARRQQEILDQAARMLRPQGRMVYSTCTFAPEEDEGTVCAFLERHPEFYIEEARAYPGFEPGRFQWVEGWENRQDPGIDKTFRLFPHKVRGEGHYIAVLRKRKQLEWTNKPGAAPFLAGKKRKDALKDFEQFCQENLREPRQFTQRQEYILFGEQLYLLPPEMPDMKGLKVLRPGLHMGTLKKNRFEPSHALALALDREDAKRCCRLEYDRSVRYLKGETLEAAYGGLNCGVSDKGWVLVCAGDYSLGWAKLAGGILKNHYPRGLRWNW